MKSRISPLLLFLILFVILLWSGNFISIAYLLKEVEPFTALTLRFIVVSLILTPFIINVPSRKEFSYLLFATIAIVPGHFGLLFLSIANTKSLGGISILIQLSIPFSILLSWFVFNDKPKILRIIGLTIAFVGIIFLLYDPTLLSSRKAFILAIASAISLGVYFVIVKKIKSLKSISIIAWTSFLGIPMMYLFMVLNNQSFNLLYEVKSSITYYAFFYTAIGSSIIGHGIWAYLLKMEDISYLSPFLLLIPLFTSLLSIIIFDEQFNLRFILTGTTIVIGIFLVFLSKRKD